MQKYLELCVVAAMVFASGCDSRFDQFNGRSFAIELPSIDRTIADAEADDLALYYKVSVNGVLVEEGSNFGLQTYEISLAAEVGDTVNYELYWRDTNFSIDYARSIGSVVLNAREGPGFPISSYTYDIDSDRDGFTNKTEVDGGFSPISSNDNPSDPVTELDARRDFVNSTTYNEPLFGCNNSLVGGNSSWYWNLENNGILSGIEINAAGEPSFRRDRGNYETVGDGLVQITNELGESWVWRLNSDTQDLIVVTDTPWGECTRIDGRALEL